MKKAIKKQKKKPIKFFFKNPQTLKTVQKQKTQNFKQPIKSTFIITINSTDILCFLKIQASMQKCSVTP